MNLKTFLLPLGAFLAISSSVFAMDVSMVANDISVTARVINACEELYKSVNGICELKGILERAINKARSVTCRAKDNPEAVVLDDKLKWLWHENDDQYSILALEHSIKEVADKFHNAPVVANVDIASVLKATNVLLLRIEKFNENKAILIKAIQTALEALKDTHEAAPLKERLSWLSWLIQNNDELNYIECYLSFAAGSKGQPSELVNLAQEHSNLKLYYEMLVVDKGLEKKCDLSLEESEIPE